MYSCKSGIFRIVKETDPPPNKSRPTPVILHTNFTHLSNKYVVNNSDQSTKDFNKVCVRRYAGKRQRPFVPIKPRCNPTLTDRPIVGFGKQFSSTTIVYGGSQSDATTVHAPHAEYENRTNSHVSTQYLGVQDTYLHNPVDETGPIIMDTLEVPIETMVSENNEIQTIHVGNCSNIMSSNDSNAGTDETFIASTDSSGHCVVTVQKPKPVDEVQTICLSSPRPTTGVVKPSPVRTSRFATKQNFIRCGRSRMIADTHTNIPVQQFKAQLHDTSDIIGKMHIAPTTKRLMHMQNTKGAIKYIGNPGRHMSSSLSKYFLRHLTTKLTPTDESTNDMELLPLGYTPTVDPTKIKRITRKRRYPEAEEYQRKMLSEQMQRNFEHLVTESEKMQTVFLQEDEEILPDYNENDILIEDSSINLIKEEANEEVLSFNAADDHIERLVFKDENLVTHSENKQTIIMVHEGEQSVDGTTFTPKNIEVLLAAAEKQGISRNNIQQVIFCQSASGDYLPESDQMVSMPVDPLGEELPNGVAS